MKSKLKFGILAACILALLLYCFLLFMNGDLADSKKMESVSESVLEQNISGKTKASDDEVLGNVYYMGYQMPYSEYNHTYYVTLTDNALPKASDFTLETTQTKDKVNAYFTTLPDNADDLKTGIAEGKAYDLTVVRGDQYYTYDIIFTSMPVMNITFTDQTVEGGSNGDYTVVTIQLQNGDKQNGEITESSALMRVRGGVSRNYPKLGFKLKFADIDNYGNYRNKDVSLLGMRTANNWKMSALYADDAKIRDKVAIDLWADMSEDNKPVDAAWGTRMEYTEVVMNGQYMGMYGLMESIDEQQLDINDDEEIDGLYEYIYKKDDEGAVDPALFTFEEGTRIPEKDQDESYSEIAGLELKNGYGHLANDAWAPIRTYAQMVQDGNYDEVAPELLDLDNVSDIWILIQTIMGVDNHAKNLYYIAKVENGKHKIYFIPWDMDMTWGNQTDLDSVTLQSYYTYPVDHIIPWSTADVLMDSDVGNIKEIITKRWADLREGILSDESITSRMQEQIDYICGSGAFARDAQRWEDGAHTDDFSKITTIAVERLAAIDDYIDAGFPAQEAIPEEEDAGSAEGEAAVEDMDDIDD